jgi:hypothetical protein
MFLWRLTAGLAQIKRLSLLLLPTTSLRPGSTKRSYLGLNHCMENIQGKTLLKWLNEYFCTMALLTGFLPLLLTMPVTMERLESSLSRPL